MKCMYNIVLHLVSEKIEYPFLPLVHVSAELISVFFVFAVEVDARTHIHHHLEVYLKVLLS